MPGTDDQDRTDDQSDGNQPEGREHRTTRERIISALLGAAAAIGASAIGQVAGEAIAKALGL
ncbi:hypothetical protein SAZ11_08260 [Streptomyces sp. FXJ1.4098]|nr:hypothetical protein [Streptomyces sp. FXJ1.4098]